jgi:hypothetical protein
MTLEERTIGNYQYSIMQTGKGFYRLYRGVYHIASSYSIQGLWSEAIVDSKEKHPTE